tara:strand:+ start:448 stop:615 length:168 start_codon:yes stop_codon:yes gene_type:complete
MAYIKTVSQKNFNEKCKVCKKLFHALKNPYHQLCENCEGDFINEAEGLIFQEGEI